MKKLVNVVIPLYKNTLKDSELLSLRRCFQILGRYDITTIAPDNLDLTPVSNLFPQLKIERFEPHLFEGRKGYNKLMMTTDIYKRFRNWEYILIHQTDVYVFDDSLENWCRKNFDYIGAPWLEKSYHSSYIHKLFSTLDTFFNREKEGYDQRFIHRGKVGNGGLSLRKVDSFISFLENNQEKADHYIERCDFHRFFEDVFWAIEPQHSFKYPSTQEALRFSFDTYPWLCYKENNKNLPFGCHAFTKWKTILFWKQHIADL